MPKTSIIFDLDGTLLDTLPTIAATCNKSLKDFGFPTHPVDSYRTFVGDGLYTLIRRIFPEGSAKEVIEQGILKFEEEYGEHWKENCYPYPGISAMLSALKIIKLRLGVLSDKPHSFTVQFIDEFLRRHQ
jgi:phosphoglycolate phosphatase